MFSFSRGKKKSTNATEGAKVVMNDGFVRNLVIIDMLPPPLSEPQISYELEDSYKLVIPKNLCVRGITKFQHSVTENKKKCQFFSSGQVVTVYFIVVERKK